MTDRILFVDDESSVLDGYRRLLQRHFNVETARGGSEGLALIERTGTFAVVVSDMRMPVMNGADFLGHVRLRAPETVRMLLTGYADVNAAMDAVNKGNIFRYLTKPCSGEALVDALNLGLAQYHAAVASNALAQRALMADRGSWAPIESVPFDNVGNAAALPGPQQARAHLARIGNDPQFHAVLFRFRSSLPGPSGSQSGISECVSIAAGYLQESLSVDDRLYRWEEHTLMVLARRRSPVEKLRNEVERLTAGARNYVAGIREGVITCSIESEILSASQISDRVGQLTTAVAR